jgi:hypothetical protein
MHATVGTRPAFELLCHEELAVSVVGERDQNIAAGSKLERKMYSERHLRMCEGERDNNTYYVKEERERESEREKKDKY